jgi:hypothetical protein
MAPPLPPEPISFWSLLIAEHMLGSLLLASWPSALLFWNRLL